MSKIPCRKCEKCGYYHDFTTMVCSNCNENIEKLPIFMIEKNDVPGEKFGEMEVSTFFVQKCPRCDVLNFTTDKNNRIKVCCNCHRNGIALIEPTEYVEPSDEKPNKESPIKEDVKPVSDSQTQSQSESTPEPVRVSYDDDDDNDNDNDPPWLGMLRKNIEKEIDRSEINLSPKNEPQPSKVVKQADVYDDDDDDDEVPGWSAPLGIKSEPAKTVGIQNKPITLSAMRYGTLTFTVEPNPNKEYMLGRSANQGEFLEQDKRVSNNHCFLYFNNGSWYVKDNNSSNGTAVNSRDIGISGECKLNDGDELKLGHEPDSMMFKVIIK